MLEGEFLLQTDDDKGLYFRWNGGDEFAFVWSGKGKLLDYLRVRNRGDTEEITMAHVRICCEKHSDRVVTGIWQRIGS